MPPNSTYRDMNIYARSSTKKDVSSFVGKRSRSPSPKNNNQHHKNKKSHNRSHSSNDLPIRVNWLTLASVFCMISGFIFYLAPLERIFFGEPPKCASTEEEFGYLAKVDQHFDQVYHHKVKCHEPGYRRERMLKAAPKKCGTLVYDELMTTEEALELRKMAAKLVYEMGETNPFSRESVNLHWVNLHHVFKKGYKQNVFNESDFNLIKRASERARNVIAETFGLPREQMFFTTVAQFTRYRPMTRYSQFRHVDKVRSQSLVVTSILWLSNYDYDFGGGRTAFLTGGPKPFTPLLVEPKVNRFAAWTSGWENPHEVMQMMWGERLALIFAFTVNPYLGERSMDTMKAWAQSIPDNPFMA
ncbi:2-oxoglutarate and iron-dependent oxygenase domain-containing protein 3-like [Brevipalpus obovatus]|uniref:2-oxoglutarate and iron-dependent oxygenase domain-containing protein 3-like n=1 Tax=Brevipalpus obovatus TaxID=246614 RepID=UPI003D9F8A3C